ncbi:MAG: hypothetical protein ACPLZD_05040 [Candidatus Saccharicenans sp.]|nr:MAG: hypothetical protein C0168_08940 [Candidatus Aminicenantes bacterium]HEK85248.1 hypothetical protein [Candidatus Aminicenantes bacterium]
MEDEKWKKELNRYFEDLRIIEKCQQEAREHFDQFCEFIVEPALETLEDELKARGIKIKYFREKNKFIHLQINFPNSKVDNFHYRIILPSNSLDLKLILQTKGRKNKKSPLVSKEKPFRPEIKPEEVLKLSKDDIIIDIIKELKEFNYAARTSPD